MNIAMKSTLNSTMASLKSLGTEQTKKAYRNHGAQEPLFVVTLRDMKPLAKIIKKGPFSCHRALRHGQL